MRERSRKYGQHFTLPMTTTKIFQPLVNFCSTLPLPSPAVVGFCAKNGGEVASPSQAGQEADDAINLGDS